MTVVQINPFDEEERPADGRKAALTAPEGITPVGATMSAAGGLKAALQPPEARVPKTAQEFIDEGSVIDPKDH